jgi:hypothetical protein
VIRKADDQSLKGGLGGSAGPLIPPAVVSPATPVVQIDERTPAKDVKLIAAAVRQGWVVTDRMLETIPLAMAQVVLRGDDERAKVNAAKVLVQMYGQNNPPTGKGTNVNVGVVVNHPGADLLD